MNFDNELWIVVTLCALPFLAFGLAELFMLRRRKKAEAIARRRKTPVGELVRRR